MATVRMSEKEAIARGLIKPPPPPVAVHPAIGIPTFARLAFYLWVGFVIGWLAGLTVGYIIWGVRW